MTFMLISVETFEFLPISSSIDILIFRFNHDIQSDFFLPYFLLFNLLFFVLTLIFPVAAKFVAYIILLTSVIFHNGLYVKNVRNAGL